MAAPDRIWVTDINYLAIDESWLYLASLKDLDNGELVGHASKLWHKKSGHTGAHACLAALSEVTPSYAILKYFPRGQLLFLPMDF